MKIKDLFLMFHVKVFDINTIPNGLEVGDFVILNNGNLAKITIRTVGSNGKPVEYGARDISENSYLTFNYRGREITKTSGSYDILRPAYNEDLVHLIAKDLGKLIS